MFHFPCSATWPPLAMVFRHNTIMVQQTPRSNLNKQDDLYLLLCCLAWRLLLNAVSHLLYKVCHAVKWSHRIKSFQQCFLVLLTIWPGFSYSLTSDEKKNVFVLFQLFKCYTQRQQGYFNRGCIKETGGDLLIQPLMSCSQRLCSHAPISSWDVFWKWIPLLSAAGWLGGSH